MLADGIGEMKRKDFTESCKVVLKTKDCFYQKLDKMNPPLESLVEIFPMLAVALRLHLMNFTYDDKVLLPQKNPAFS